MLVELDVLDEVREPTLGQLCPVAEVAEPDWEVVVVVVVVDDAARTALIWRCFTLRKRIELGTGLPFTRVRQALDPVVQFG